MINDWMDVVVRPSQSIRESWRILNDGALRFVMVTDDSYKLLGVVTDGDIRRGLLSGMELGDSISAVMNKSPITIPRSMEKQALIDLMEERKVLALPQVDNGVLVGLAVLQDLLQVPVIDNPVFIMAGGFGTRLRPLTDSCPKPMLKIGGTPMLEILIKSFKAKGFRNFYISTHYLPEVITEYFGDGSDFGVCITYVHEKSPLGTGGALGLLPSNIPKLPLIVINGDILTNLDYKLLLDEHSLSAASATMCVRAHEVNIPFGVIEADDNKITAMVEKPTYRYFVNTGIYVISPEVLAFVKKDVRLDMPTLLQSQIDNGKLVKTKLMHDYWLDIGRMDDFNKAQVDILTLGLKGVL
ncbi:nucleotidyltransferase family protein [Marinagarivorans algicola]|uniref:nucleotidyltransferase family protein n=1 Tax=Marinagarivorans algicola TaxID=1513270 RepID=UPI0006B51F90|nr:nucleotidyltransferase family protein [Marinagarivorans algicola]